MLNPLQQTGFLIHLESLLAIFAEQGPHKDSRSQQDPASPREKEGLSRSDGPADPGAYLLPRKAVSHSSLGPFVIPRTDRDFNSHRLSPPALKR